MTQSDEQGDALGEAADTDLVLRTRSGDSDAYGELWRRHYRSGLTVARNVTSSIDPDDLVQEAYARIYQSIRKGGGPTGSFRAYLFTSIRNTAAGWGRARKETNLDEFENVEDPTSTEQATNDALDRSLTHRAFRSLPTRWQEVLWYTEIERMGPAEIAPLLGMKATAVAQLAFRAREGLRQAWIQAHLNNVEDGSEHQWTIERLGAFARNNLGVRERTRVEDHLAACTRCAIVASEAKEVGSRLALVLLPLALGAAGAAGYLAALQGGGVPVTVALAAMPSAVTQGAVTVGAGSAGASGASLAAAGNGGGAGTGAGAGSTGTAGVAGAAGGAAAGGILSGVGGVIALVAAGVVLVGGIATAVVLPGVLAGNDGSTTAGEAPLAPNPGAEAPAPATSPSPSVTPSTLPLETVEEIVVPMPPVEQSRPPAPPAPQVPAPTPTQPPAPPPVEPTDPPVEPTDPPVEPPDPPTEPSVPSGTPTLDSAKATWVTPFVELELELVLRGEPGAEVDVLFFASASTPSEPGFVRDMRANGTFDEHGALTVSMKLSLTDYLFGSLRLQYIKGDELGELGAALTLDRTQLADPPVVPPVSPTEP